MKKIHALPTATAQDTGLKKIIKDAIDSILKFFARRSPVFIILLGLILLGLTAFLNFIAHYKLSLAIFYLIPICLVSWYAGRNVGLLFSLMSAVALTVSHYEQILTLRQWIAQIWNSTGTFCFYILIVLALRLVKIRLLNERELAHTDPLTGMANRRSFLISLDHEIKKSQRYKHPFSVAFMDLDNFKAVNDNQGHQAGDRLLLAVAASIQGFTRATDIAARLGGDEFAIIFPETDAEQVKQAMARIQPEITKSLKEQGWPITFSTGSATFHKPPGSVDEVFQHVDVLMYAVKKRGKNGIEYNVF